MTGSTFTTNPVSLDTLLRDAASGRLQLPDFQRSWVWDEERIRSLIASVTRGFPVGALMTLEAGSSVLFKPRPIEGADATATFEPESLLLDGQQRITSLYQVALRGEVVKTVTPKRKTVRRWFYIDMQKALDAESEREAAILSVPEDKVLRSDFGRRVELDLSTRDAEIEERMFPVASLLSFSQWQGDYISKYAGDPDFPARYDFLMRFNKTIVETFVQYQVPVIRLDKGTSKEAVCVVFEKVNTGGKPLDAFELITAMYAADGYQLRRDWYGDATTRGLLARFAAFNRLPNASEGILANVDSTDVLHVISLWHTRDRRDEALAAGRTPKDSPQIIGNRAALLNLPLAAYKRYLDAATDGFERAAKFLHTLKIFRPYDLPYQTQIVPLAAILGEHPEIVENAATRRKLTQWYWNGVFGELYGSTTETRIARDFQEVVAWILHDGPRPTTIDDATFRSDRLLTMRMRLSAAYKGVNALLMERGALDFRTGQVYGDTVFFDENVDIHHIFPKAWCEAQGIDRSEYDSIVNKTAIAARTNRIIGGEAPSLYLEKLRANLSVGDADGQEALVSILESHLIDGQLLATDDFKGFMRARQEQLLVLIEEVTGQRAYRDFVPAESIEDEDDESGDVVGEMTPAGSFALQR